MKEYYSIKLVYLCTKNGFIMEEKKNWGGKREGSGRKKKAESTIISIKLNNDLLEAFPSEIMDKDGKLVKFNRSEYINNVLRAKMKEDGFIE